MTGRDNLRSDNPDIRVGLDVECDRAQERIGARAQNPGFSGGDAAAGRSDFRLSTEVRRGVGRQRRDRDADDVVRRNGRCGAVKHEDTELGQRRGQAHLAGSGVGAPILDADGQVEDVSRKDGVGQGRDEGRYERDLTARFTRQEMRMLYANSPRWSREEAGEYGGLLCDTLDWGEGHETGRNPHGE